SRHYQNTDWCYHVLLPETLAHLSQSSRSPAGPGGYQQPSHGQRSYGLRHDVIAIAQTAPEAGDLQLCLIPRGGVSGKPIHPMQPLPITLWDQGRTVCEDYLHGFNTTFQTMVEVVGKSVSRHAHAHALWLLDNNHN
ncbi:hypothetical protein NEUTE1DRAFT_42803, partial [Neurospora tetrasperma FGSC 2508]